MASRSARLGVGTSDGVFEGARRGVLWRGRGDVLWRGRRRGTLRGWYRGSDRGRWCRASLRRRISWRYHGDAVRRRAPTGQPEHRYDDQRCHAGRQYRDQRAPCSPWSPNGGRRGGPWYQGHTDGWARGLKDRSGLRRQRNRRARYRLDRGRCQGHTGWWARGLRDRGGPRCRQRDRRAGAARSRTVSGAHRSAGSRAEGSRRARSEGWFGAPAACHALSETVAMVASLVRAGAPC